MLRKGPGGRGHLIKIPDHVWDHAQAVGAARRTSVSARVVECLAAWTMPERPADFAGPHPRPADPDEPAEDGS